LKPSAVPFKVRVTVRDRKDATRYATYIISSTRYYPGTNELPVLVGGKYWAPVNCGATQLVTDFTSSAEWSADNVGYFYQWGRNVGFWPGEDLDKSAEKFEDIEAAEAQGSHFVTGNTSYLAEALPASLWSGPRAQGPCPDGWRVPASTDVNGSLTSATYRLIQKSWGEYLEFDGPGEKHLYIISDGSVAGSTGDKAWGTNCEGWLNIAGSRLMIDYMAVQINTSDPCNGLHVRCVLAD
jgi:hypothetical protein